MNLPMTKITISANCPECGESRSIEIGINDLFGMDIDLAMIQEMADFYCEECDVNFKVDITSYDTSDYDE